MSINIFPFCYKCFHCMHSSINSVLIVCVSPTSNCGSSTATITISVYSLLNNRVFLILTNSALQRADLTKLSNLITFVHAHLLNTPNIPTGLLDKYTIVQHFTILCWEWWEASLGLKIFNAPNQNTTTIITVLYCMFSTTMLTY